MAIFENNNLDTDELKGFHLREGEFAARLIDAADEDDVRSYQVMRYEWFVLRKGWVHDTPALFGREIDHYDPFCYHLGVFQEDRLVAYIRALPWQDHTGFMLNHEFSGLVPADAAIGFTQVGAVEFSRLIVDPPPDCGRRARIQIAELLFKFVYCLGKRIGWETYYIVLEEAWLRILNRQFNLPFAPLGVPHIYPDGTKTLAAFACCGTLEMAMLATLPDKYHWYRQEIES
jgi:N-acyl-L-homoserine lactone synthetase